MSAAIADAAASGVLLSLHLKATMMKVSDPILFGHAVSAYYRAALTRHAATLEDIGFNPNNGIGDLYARLPQLPEGVRAWFQFLGDAQADNTRFDEIVVPLLHKSRPISALNILSHHTGQFTQRDVAIASQFAAHVAVALVNARLFERSRLDAEAFEKFAPDARLVDASGNVHGVKHRKLVTFLRRVLDA